MAAHDSHIPRQDQEPRVNRSPASSRCAATPTRLHRRYPPRRVHPWVARYQRAAEPLLAAIDMAGITLRWANPSPVTWIGDGSPPRDLTSSMSSNVHPQPPPNGQGDPDATSPPTLG